MPQERGIIRQRKDGERAAKWCAKAAWSGRGRKSKRNIDLGIETWQRVVLPMMNVMLKSVKVEMRCKFFISFRYPKRRKWSKYPALLITIDQAPKLEPRCSHAFHPQAQCGFAAVKLLNPAKSGGVGYCPRELS